MKAEEIWRDIPGYEGYYVVSDYGRAKSVNRNIIAGGAIKNRVVRERILRQQTNPKGYYFFHVSRCGKIRNLRTHRIVAKLFVPNPSDLPEVNHKNEIKSDNNAANLEWCDRQFNIQYGTGIDRKTKSQKGSQNIKNSGEGCGTSKLKENQVLSIYSDLRKYKEIAKEYNINISAISKIKHKTRWCKLLKIV